MKHLYYESIDITTVILLSLIWPVGLIVMWLKTKWSFGVKLFFTVFFIAAGIPAILFLTNLIIIGSSNSRVDSEGDYQKFTKYITFTAKDNNNVLTKSNRYRFSFESSPDLELLPPINTYIQDGNRQEQVSFHSPTQDRGDSEFRFIVVIREDPNKEAFSTLSFNKTENISIPGAETAVREQNEYRDEVVAHANGITYTLTHNHPRENKDAIDSIVVKHLTPDPKDVKYFEEIVSSFRLGDFGSI